MPSPPTRGDFTENLVRCIFVSASDEDVRSCVTKRERRGPPYPSGGPGYNRDLPVEPEGVQCRIEVHGLTLEAQARHRN